MALLAVEKGRDKRGRFIKGHLHSEESRRKMSASHKGVPSSNKGRRHSVEQNKKMSETNRKRWENPEYRKRMSEVHMGGPGFWTGKKRPDISGRNSSTWKGGITPENHLIRNSPEMDDWRRQVFERDDYTCQSEICKYECKTLHSHHLLGFAEYPEYRFYVENGIALCKRCHDEIHSESRRRD